MISMADEIKKAAQNKEKTQSARPSRSKRYVSDLRKIWVGARELGLDSDVLHDLVNNLFDKDSLKKLTQAERTKLIKDLESKGAYIYRGDKRRKPRGKGTATDIITPAQQEYIHKLWVKLSEYGEEFSRSQWQAAFIERVIGKRWPQKKWEAQKIIEALKKRLAQVRKRGIK